MPTNHEVFQPMTNLKPDEPRLVAIEQALAHPRFYNGDIGADIRWLLEGYVLLRQHAESHRRDYASLAASLDAADRQCAQLRAALVKLVGASGRAELEQMEIAMRSLPAPAEDKAATIDAIHALIATGGE